MADFWGVTTTTTEGYDPHNSRPSGAVRRHTKITGFGVATGKGPGPILVNPVHLEWQARAACFGMDGDLFFDDDDAYADQLRPICGACPVQQMCLDYANKNRLVGFWGGTTHDERRRLRVRDESRARRQARAIDA